MRTHHPSGWLKPLAVATTLVVAMATIGVVRSVTAGAADTVPPSLVEAIQKVVSQERYAHSTWRFRVEDRETGDVLFDQGGEQMATTGSLLKVYTTSTALHLYGPDHRFATPVFRTGPVHNGAVHGDLVLVASGDFSMGLRE